MTCPHDHGDSNGGNSNGGNSNGVNRSPVSQLYSRRGVVVALASTTMLCAESPVAVAFAPAEDQAFMRLALDEARRGDYPFGAMIVRDDKVIARGRNLGKVHDDPLRDRRAVPDVHGRDHMVPCRAARFRRLHQAIGHQD
jgi:hypothetical protein